MDTFQSCRRLSVIATMFNTRWTRRHQTPERLKFMVCKRRKKGLVADSLIMRLMLSAMDGVKGLVSAIVVRQSYMGWTQGLARHFIVRVLTRKCGMNGGTAR